jgi:hypothetical protein
MNGELPPIDADVRDQLARRAGGRLPETLAAEVFTALDSTPRRMIFGRVPRLAVAGMGVALVVVVLAAIALSAVHTPPAASPTSPVGYPAERALTTAELASLMAGPALPLNTALVASVTIDVRNDVCPMNSRPTVGVIEGMGSQVCVMGATLDATLPGTTTTATFAFRYLAPGYLGLLDQITPASSSRLAYQVADQWPLAGNTFLVDGWFYQTDLGRTLFSAGGVPLACPVNTPRPVGDPLNPNGQLMCEIDWLSDDANAAPSTLQDGSHVAPTNSRLVEAAGMATIDSVATDTPVHGVFVVRGTTAPCPNASPQDSFGCWSGPVLAKLADVSLPAPNYSPPAATPTPAPKLSTAIALTSEQLAALMSGPALPTNATLVASVASVDARTDGCPLDGYTPLGLVNGIDPPVCVVGPAGTTLGILPGAGTFAFRYLAPGYLGLIGRILPATGTPVFSVRDDWPLAGTTFLVDGYLGAVNTQSACASLPPAVNVLTPDGAACGSDDWLSDDPTAPQVQAEFDQAPSSPSTDQLSLRGNARHVAADGARAIDSIPGAPTHGTYVVRGMTGPCPGAAPQNSQGCDTWRVLAKVADIALPTARTITPPARPISMPSSPAGSAAVGLLGPGNLPLTELQLATLWAADPAHLVGRTAIVSAPIPAGFQCVAAGSTSTDATRPGCVAEFIDGQKATQGNWAVQVEIDGTLTLRGEVAFSVATQSPAFSVDELASSTNIAAGSLVVIDGWLLEHVPTCDYGATPLPAGCGPFSEIASMATDNSPASIGVQQGAYQQSTGAAGDWTVDGPPVRGFYLVRLETTLRGTLLSRLEVVATP